jgi:hypothetical protein
MPAHEMPKQCSASNAPGRYDRARVARLQKLEAAVERLRLQPLRARKLGAILRALEMQIEDGGDSPEVNRLLLDALRAGIRHQVDEPTSQQALQAIDQFEQAESVRRRFLAATAAQSDPSGGGPTVGALLAAVDERAAERRRREAERAAAERARREHEAAVARAMYVDRLAGREEDLWRQVGALVETKRPKDYDQAGQLLTDLRDLSVRRQEVGAFAARLGPLRERCANRPRFLDRLDRAGLIA